MLLLLDRPKRKEIRLPKGHIEPGETPAVAALREVTEETGLAQLEIVSALGQQIVEFEYKGDRYRRTEHYFLMRKYGDQQAPRPAKDKAHFRPFWAPLAEAVNLLTFSAERSVAQKGIAVYEIRAGPVRLKIGSDLMNKKRGDCSPPCSG